LATVPQLTTNDYRDSGVFTAAFGINLRDQVRANDTEPLQFKYEPADCRIFYTVANVFNYTRLWSDAVTAMFDDTSKCVAGSTGFSTSNKTAPKPAPAAPAPLSLDMGQSDALLDGDNLDESGGPQNTGELATSFTITRCPRSKTCKTSHAQRCENITVTVCGEERVRAYCLPQTQDPSLCDPVDAEWEEVEVGDVGRGSLKRRQLLFALPPKTPHPSTSQPVGGAPASGVRPSVPSGNGLQQRVIKYGRCRPKKRTNFRTRDCPLE